MCSGGIPIGVVCPFGMQCVLIDSGCNPIGRSVSLFCDCVFGSVCLCPQGSCVFL